MDGGQINGRDVVYHAPPIEYVCEAIDNINMIAVVIPKNNRMRWIAMLLGLGFICDAS